MATQTRARPVPQAPAQPRINWLRPHMRGIIIRQIFLQLFLLLMMAIVLFPVLWIISMAVDPRGITRPTDLNLFPANANLDAFYRLLTEPFTNVLPVYFGDLLMNSLFIALGTSIFTVVLGSSAAYAFSRFRFIGRQFGMLGFIILLMLPTTGVVIPLYILFNAVPINRGLAAVFPALFNGLFVATIIWIVYTMIRTYGKRSPDRWFNPSPLSIAIITALIALVAIALAFVVMFERSPQYAATYKAPVAAIQEEFVAAREDYNQRVGSVAQRDQTATRREERAAVAAEEATLIAGIAQQANEGGDIAALIAPEIEARQEREDAEDDLVLQNFLAVQTALDAGDNAGALALLNEGVTTLQTEATDAAEGAATARANAEEAAANLVTSEQELLRTRAAVDAEAAAILADRDRVLVAIIPYILLAWGAALVGAAVVWAVVWLLRGTVEPRAVVNLLAWAVLLSVMAGVAFVAWQGRIGNENPNGTETLRTTLLGLALAFASGGLPFAIWNLKGYFDTIPKELEEAALIDGAGLIGTFVRVMIPLALPAFAIVILFSFMNGWTEFILSWVFLTGQTESYTLAMALATMANGANQAPPDMQKFAAMAILISIPIMVLFFAFQRWIVGGLAIGGVKG